MGDPTIVRIVCGLLAVALLALIILRRRKRQAD
jgi:MYXO-CTERM domain-containing protein